MTSPQIIAVMALMREIEKPSACYNRAVRRASQTLTDSPENEAAQARGNGALLEIEQAVRAWVTKHPEPEQARRILGTTEQADTETAPAADRATVLREAADALDALEKEAWDGADSDEWIGRATGVGNAKAELRRLADEAQQPTPAVAGCEHVWTTALDGDDEPALTASGRTWTHCGICGQPSTPAPAEETK